MGKNIILLLFFYSRLNLYVMPDMTAIPVNSLWAVLAGICSVSFLYFGMYILVTALRDKSIRPLFYLCVFSSLWCVSYMLYYLSGDTHSRDIWQRFTFAGMIAFVYTLWFIIRYTGLIKNRKAESVLSIAVWLPPLVSVYKSISENAIARDFPSGFWFLYAEILTTVYNLSSIAFLLVFFFGNKTNKSRRQAIVLSVSAVVLMAMSWCADYFFGVRNTQNMIPFWLVLWIGILLFSIKKYRFISIIPVSVGRDITENIEEGIILLDPDLKITFMNTAMLKLAELGGGETGLLDDIVAEKHVLNDELSILARGGKTSFRTRINLIQHSGGARLPVDIKGKKLIDNYNDTYGYLMIVSRVRDMGYLRTHYGISVREMEVVRQLALGKSNKDIARFLSIKESTIETHTRNIYNKLGINNRIELLNLLFEFALSHPLE